MKTIELNSKEIKYLKKVIKTTGHFVFKGEKELGNNLIDKMDKALLIQRVSKRFWYFDCWDRKGKTTSRQIEALNAENAEIIFKARYPDLGYDPPY